MKYNNGIYIDQTLQYISANSVLINASIHSDIEIKTELQWFGELLIDETKYENIAGGFQFSLDNGLIIQARFSDPYLEIKLSGNSYESITPNLINIGKESITIQAIISIFQKNDIMDTEIEFVQSVFIDSNRIKVKHKNRWDKYALSISSINKDTPRDIFVLQQSIAVKSILTLINNWRAPYGELKHEGLFPSYARGYFRGFWAWDSWKHAVALAYFEPDVAKNQVRAKYDFQDQHGMIADCVFPDTTIENHNWRDTKPPLSAWAVWSIYEQTKDSSFVAELYFKILKYHEWWYKNRDHDGNGLCEYGSTDGTEIAARWESGMDNAVRFDNIKMLRNNQSAWSMNQESVDLNSYLFAEKKYLKNMATILVKNVDVKKYISEAAYLKKQIQSLMYDPSDGYFYDIKLDDKSFVKVKGPEGWIPLWAGVASQAQADAVIEKILDPKIFNTKIPFPTLDTSHSEFNPEKGYWRGPVWMDQAYFALIGLKQYGYKDEALNLTFKIFNEIQHSSLYENYNPITGQGLNSPHFSWTAAHLYLMYIEILKQD
jgi:putative isomerase